MFATGLVGAAVGTLVGALDVGCGVMAMLAVVVWVAADVGVGFIVSGAEADAVGWAPQAAKRNNTSSNVIDRGENMLLIRITELSFRSITIACAGSARDFSEFHRPRTRSIGLYNGLRAVKCSSASRRSR